MNASEQSPNPLPNQLQWITKLNKYHITIILFGIYMLFLDDNNIVRSTQLSRERKELKKKVEKHREELRIINEKLDNLSVSDECLEHIAREQYLMHAKDEQIFIVE